MIYALVRFLRPETRTWLSAISAFGVCVAVEVGQLYHAPWIEAIRETRLGTLALGNIFNWPDIPAYAAGVLAGWLVDRAIGRE